MKVSPMQPAPQRIELHIDQLLLHGFAPHERGAIAQAVEAELLRLLQEEGLPPNLGERREIPHVDGGTYAGRSGIRPQEAGVQIAQAIYRGLSRQPLATPGQNLAQAPGQGSK